MKSAIRFLSLILIVLLLTPITAFAQESQHINGTTQVVIDETEPAQNNEYSHKRYAPFVPFSTSFKIIALDQSVYRNGRSLSSYLQVALSQIGHAIHVYTYYEKYNNSTGKWESVNAQVNVNFSSNDYKLTTNYTATSPGRYRVLNEVTALSKTLEKVDMYIISDYFEVL